MIKAAAGKTNISLFNNHTRLLYTINHFDRALRHLRFEGKLHLGNNYSEVCRVTKTLKKELDSHFKTEKDTVFPFLKRHMPKLEPIACLLSVEQENIKECLRSFEASLAQLSTAGSGLNPHFLERVWGRGIYLTHYLKNHFLTEDIVVFKKMRHELRKDEIGMLNRKFQERTHHERKRRKDSH